MFNVALGEHSKLFANPAERDRVRRFYTQVLGCPAMKESEKIDIFRIGTGFFLGVVYDDSALSEVDGLKSIWLDLRTSEPDALKARILEFGIQEVAFWDKEHFYFQAPGGVFRLVGKSEDMSRWQ
jgi:catechol 2,3-dioxygenase-like lactoylglutathione lyase family enzyme